MLNSSRLNNSIQPWQFNKVANFGSMQSVQNPKTGMRVQQFVKEFSLHYMTKNRTLNQQYATLGTSLENTIVIIINHSKLIQENQLVQLADGKTYRVINLSVDDSTQVTRYDYLTLSLNTKGV